MGCKESNKTNKRVLLQTVTTQMKCSIREKKILRQKNTIFFGKLKLTPLDMYNGLSQVYLSNQKEESIRLSIQRVRACMFGHLVGQEV